MSEKSGAGCVEHGGECPVTGHGAGCGCSVTGHGAGCPVTGHGSCPVCGHSGGIVDPFTNAPDLWLRDVADAIRQVKLEILKGKVQKAFGPQLEKGAEAALSAGGAVWQSLLGLSQAAQAKEDLRERLRKVFSEKTQ